MNMLTFLGFWGAIAMATRLKQQGLMCCQRGKERSIEGQKKFISQVQHSIHSFTRASNYSILCVYALFTFTYSLRTRPRFVAPVTKKIKIKIKIKSNSV
jgi:hypothetical protein